MNEERAVAIWKEWYGVYETGDYKLIRAFIGGLIEEVCR